MGDSRTLTNEGRIPPMFERLRCALVIGGMCWLCVACGDAPTSEQTVDTVRDAVAIGDRNTALAAIDRLEKTTIPSPEGMLELAGLWASVGEPGRAVWHLEEGVRRFPDEHRLRVALGRAAMLVSNPALAIRAAGEVPAESDVYLSAQVLLGEAQIKAGDLDAGLETLRRLDQSHPHAAETALARIGTLLAERDADAARDELARARTLTLSPEQSAAADGLELLLYRVELNQEDASRDEAVSALMNLVDRRPDFWAAWELLVTQLATAGRLEAARERVEGALLANPELVPLHALNSVILRALGEEDEALAAAERFAHQAKTPRGWAVVAEHHQASGDAEAMLSAFERGLELYPDDPGLAVSRAESLIILERLDEAREALSQVPRAFRESPKLEIVRARVELAEGDAAAARERLERVVSILDDSSAQFWLGAALEELGMTEGAIRRYGLAHMRGPLDPVPSLALQRLYFRNRDLRGAAMASADLIKVAPALDEGWIGLVEAQILLGDPRAALAAVKPLRAAAPDRAIGPRLSARALRDLGRFDEAAAALDSAEALGADVAVDRAVLKSREGRHAEAIADLTALARERPDDAAIQLALTKVAFVAGDETAGSEAADKAMRLQPDNLAPLRERCFFRAAQGKEVGVADCARYLDAHPGDSEAHYFHGSLLATLGRTTDAIGAYRRAADLDRSDFRSRNNLATLLGKVGDLDAALDAAQEAYALSNEHPVVGDTLGSLYVARGLPARAVPLLESAYAGAANAEIGLHLAEAYRALGRQADLEQILAAISSLPDFGPEEQATAEALSRND